MPTRAFFTIGLGKEHESPCVHRRYPTGAVHTRQLEIHRTTKIRRTRSFHAPSTVRMIQRPHNRFLPTWRPIMRFTESSSNTHTARPSSACPSAHSSFLCHGLEARRRHSHSIVDTLSSLRP